LQRYSCAKKLQSQTVTREKLRKILLFEKCARQMLMKLTPGVDFINILQAAFSYERVLRSFSLLTVFVYFWRKNIGKKDAGKMLVK